jgi:ATP-binding cassette subfamily B protein
LLRLYEPTHGRILIDGQPLDSYTQQSLREQMSVVLQESLLFGDSVRANIRYGAPDADDEEVEAAARQANAHDFIMALPAGYDTILGERGATLSGGQRQRIAIARAAIRRAPIVILDEPTTGLDEANAQAVNGALDRLMYNCTGLIITHDLKLAARADRILYLEAGRIVEQGSHADLMSLQGRYAATYAMQHAAGAEGVTVAAAERWPNGVAS